MRAMPEPLEPNSSAASQTSHPLNGDRKVAIVGGGPAGMALALALRHFDIAAEIFDGGRRDHQLTDKRALALSHGSKQILTWLGVWNELDATPITAIHVSQRGGFGRTRITAA